MYCKKSEGYGKIKKVKSVFAIFICLIICSVMSGCKTQEDVKIQVKDEIQENDEMPEDDNEHIEIPNFNHIESIARVRNTNGKWGFIDQRGMEIIECKYDMVKEFAADGLVIVGDSRGVRPYYEDEYLWGVVDWNGNEIIPIQYTEVFINANEELIWVRDQRGKAGALSYSGKEIIPLEYDGYYPEETVTRWHVVSIVTGYDEYGSEIEKYGYVKKSGEVIECQYNSVTDFDAEGHAVVSVLQNDKEQYMLINESGEIVEKYDYSYVGEFGEDGVARFVDSMNDYLSGYINKDGERVFESSQITIEKYNPKGLIVARNDEGYGFVNEKGEEIVPCQYYAVSEFAKNGLAMVAEKVGQKNIEFVLMKCGYIDQTGKKVIPLQYDFATEFTESGVALVGKYEERGINESQIIKYGYINEKGEEVVPFQYDCWDGFELTLRLDKFAGKGLIELSKFCGDDIYNDYDYKYGVADTEGNMVLECEYDYLLCNENSNVLAVGQLLNDSDTDTERMYSCKYVDFEGNTVLEVPDKYVYAGCLLNVCK